MDTIEITLKHAGQQYDWTIPAEAVDSLTSYMQAQVEAAIVPVDAGGTQQWTAVQRTKYGSVAEMIVQRVIDSLIEPALEQFPPPTIARLKQQAEASAQAVMEAKKAVAAQIAHAKGAK